LRLQATRAITWQLPEGLSAFSDAIVHFGKGPQPIQVALAHSVNSPSRGQMKQLFNERKGRLPITLILVVVHGQMASLFGPDSDTEVLTQKSSTVEAILNSILAQDNEILAYQRAASILRSKQTTGMVGFTNNGLFASHYIRSSIERHPKWKAAQEQSHIIQNLREKELITALGFEITSNPSSTYLLKAQGPANRVVAILLDQSEGFDSKSPRFQASPIEWGLAIAAQQRVPWVIAIKDSQLRLYPALDGVGVGQKSQAETYFEIDLLTIDDDKAGLLSLIFSAEALAEDGTADELLKNSRKFAAELGVRLRERVYESVVPDLATEIANQLREKGHVLEAKGLQLAYELTLRVLFRLLFQAYAEDRGLLPAGRNEIFDSNSMKHWAEYLIGRDPDAPFGDSSTIWMDLAQIWNAIDQGSPDMQIPAYNGGLFGASPDLHPEGALIQTLSIPDRVMGPALRALVVDDNTEDGVAGAVDFRSLSVREFGTIYEGLLESSLSVADQDLTLDKKGAWVPASEESEVLVRANEVYFHNSSGERKATGSYYTPSFIVDHLIERSVEPALNDHLARVKAFIESGDQPAAYKNFFDFRVADLAMGSAHFLVAAIDKIETLMRTFLLQPGNEIEGVSAELLRLEQAAKEALGKDEAAYSEIERASLLRRQIARRCIYGLDINPLAVELSRLAIWIHTFVPGLPMSSLEHNLVCANSLTGIGSVDEGLNALIPEREKAGSTLFDAVVEQSLKQARELLEEVANADEADKRQALRSAEIAKEARAAAARSKMIFDLAVANRNGVISSGAALTEEDLYDLYSNQKVKALIDAIEPAHMPYLFPEVFLRDNPGFDVLIGNPPWEELMIEEPKFWLRVRPGLLGLSPQQMTSEIESLRERYPRYVEVFESEKIRVTQARKAVLSGPFPGLGKGDVDLYKIFAWRNWQLTRRSGRVGIVTPKSLMNGAGSFEWRKDVFASSILNLTYLVNTNRWLFESVHAQYSIVLLSLFRTEGNLDTMLHVNGPFSALADFQSGRTRFGSIPIETVQRFSESLIVPVLEDLRTIEVFRKFGAAERFDSTSQFRFVPVREFDATNDRVIFDTASQGEPGAWPVLGGSSLNLWGPGSGEPYAHADPAPALEHLYKKRMNQHRNKRSAFSALSSVYVEDRSTIEALRERISVRDVTNSVDRRTVIASLVPANRFLVNSAPYLLRIRGTEDDEAFLLAVLSSMPLDWFARKYVVLHLNFHLLNSLPIPNLDQESPLFKRIVQLTRGLIVLDGQASKWVERLSVQAEQLETSDDKQRAIEELDALVALAYGLSSEDLQHIYYSFHKTQDYSERLGEVLRHFERWSNE